jgi:hypothetical protein
VKRRLKSKKKANPVVVQIKTKQRSAIVTCVNVNRVRIAFVPRNAVTRMSVLATSRRKKNQNVIVPTVLVPKVAIVPVMRKSVRTRVVNVINGRNQNPKRTN